MVFGMATAKITITLQDDQVHAIREFVAVGKASSVSAFVQHAVGIALFDAAGWQTMLHDALQQTGGALTKEERAWADGLLHPPEDHRPGKKKSSGRSSTGRNKAA
jgi:Arc/MetJ-type ribon-helix-helix transcriptional regulator